MTAGFPNELESQRSIGTKGTLLRVMGVDPGSHTTGYGVIESDGRRYKLIEYAGIRAPSGLAFAERLLVISKKLEEVIERLTPQALQ